MMNEIWFKIFLVCLTRHGALSVASSEADEFFKHIQTKFGTQDDLSAKEKELCNTIDVLEKENRELREKIKSNSTEEDIDVFQGVVPVRHAISPSSYIYPCFFCNSGKVSIDEFTLHHPCNDCKLEKF